SEEQKNIAEEYMKWLTDNKIFEDPIVTELKPLEAFYKAELEHHTFYNRNREMGYCQYIINPKIAKIRKHYSSKLKEEYTN
ncbi:MAG: peptide-methionine (S)-S-oxide reductase, partial [Leeuwenhoekiella sp.]